MAKITISFTLDDEDDQGLLIWLKRQLKRKRSAAIREALYAHLNSGVKLSDVYRKLCEVDAKLAAGVTMAAVGTMAVGDVSEPTDVAMALDSLGL